MLRTLRIQLTLIYFLAGILLVSIMGVGLYWRLTSYFQTSTDLALKYRLAQELRQLSAPITPDLEEAEQDWINKINSGFPTKTQTNTPLESTSTATQKPTVISTKDEPEQETEEEHKDSGGGGDHLNQKVLQKFTKSFSIERIQLNSQYPQIISSTPTPISDGDLETSPLLEGELALIFVIPLDNNGNIQQIITVQPYPIGPQIAAIQSASINGEDLRTIKTENGLPVRLLTYKLPEGYQTKYLQLGRPIDDQIRLLNQYLMGLIMIGLAVLFIVGILSWWMAGRSLMPAQRSLEEQQSFIANASHELRTPLTLIRAGTELASRSLPDGEPKVLLAEVMQDVDYMNKMVEDLLLMSRLDNKRLEITLKPTSVNTLLKDIQSQAKMIAGGKIVQTKLIDEDVFVLADPDRLRQVLLIMLDNAIQHTPDSGQIQLGAAISRKQVAIMISDTGSGIPQEALPQIFKRFYKVPSHIETQNRGAGLGLSLAKSLVEMQRGQIQVNSKIGIGTQFTIFLDIVT